MRCRRGIGVLLVALVSSVATASARVPTWSATGPDGSFALARPQSLTPRLAYDMAGQDQRRTWSLMATSDVSGHIGLQFHYRGFHAYFEVTVFVDAVVVHDGQTTRTRVLAAGPADCCVSPSEGFDYAGTVGLKVEPGDTYGLEFGGGNGDSNDELKGAMEVVQRVFLSGNWHTSHGPMRLDQSGNRVTGTYAACGGDATIRGHVKGRVLYGSWHEPCTSRAGRLQLLIDPSSTTFSGTWSGHRV